MPSFQRPSLEQIVTRILADMGSKLGSQASILRRAWTRVWAVAFGGAVHLLYGFISWVKDQFFIDTAEIDAVIQKAAVYGITRLNAEYAYGVIKVTGLPGAPLPIGTFFVDSAGSRFRTQDLGSMGGDGDLVTVRAVEPGLKYNHPAGDQLQLESPVAGIDPVAVVDVDNPIEFGSDIESIESLKRRYLQRVQQPPQGGAKADYEAWAREEVGIDEVEVYSPGEISEAPFLPPYGEVWVYFSEVGSSTSPSPGKIAAVKAKIEAKMPVTSKVQVFGMSFVNVTFNISATPTAGYSFSEMREDIQNELVDLFLDGAKPFETLTLSQINEAISRPASELTHILITPSTDLTFGYNEIGRVVLPITLNPI